MFSVGGFWFEVEATAAEVVFAGSVEETVFFSVVALLTESLDTSLESLDTIFFSSEFSLSSRSSRASIVSLPAADATSELEQNRAGQKGPPPSADGAGPALTKEEVDAQIAQLGTANSERLETLKKISSNFAAADTNSDGKVSRDEANAYLQSTGDSTGRPPQAEGAGGPPPKGGAGGPPPKGGAGASGGGQDSSNKTVLSETTTVSGSLQTTTTLYTDGTSETKTQTVTAAATNSDTYSKTAITDLLKTSATPDSSASMVQNYLSSFKPGSLFDILVQ